MSASNKRSLIFIIIFLLLTNIGVLTYFLWDKKPDKPKTGKGSTGGGLAPELKAIGFDDQQIGEYKKMKDEQWKKFKPMLDDVKKAKDSLYRFISNETASDSMINNVAALIGERQKAVDLQAFSHFKRIRTLCRPDQLAKYDSIIVHAMRKMNKMPRGDQGKKEKEKK